MNQEEQNQLSVTARANGTPTIIPAHYTEFAADGKPDDPWGSENGSGLMYYWRLIWRRKGTLAAVAFLGGLGGFLVTLPQARLYQARTSVEIEAFNADFMNSRQNDPNSPSADYTESDAYIQTQMKILQSKRLADRTLAKMLRTGQLAGTPEVNRFGLLKKMLGFESPKAPNPAMDFGKALAASLTVRNAGQTRIVDLTADSTHPQMAADFLNTLTAEFIQQNLENRIHASRNTGDWLAQQVDEMRITLESSEARLQSYARENGLQFTAQKDNVSEERLRQLQDNLTKEQNDAAVKQSHYELARDANPESLPDILNDQTMRDDLAKLTDLKREYADLSALYTPEYPKVSRVQAQIVSLEAALQKQKTAILERIRNDYQEATKRQKLLADAYASQTVVVNQDAEKSIQYNILKREVDSNRQIYESMLQKIKESGIAAAMRASNFRVVDAAELPERPYKPSLPQNIALGCAAGLLFGLAFVVTREHADRTIQQPGDALSFARIPELGVIPAAGPGMGNWLRLRNHDGDMNLTLVGHRNGNVVGAPKTSPEVAEAFRSTLLSIMYSGRGPAASGVVVVSSASPGEGKTTIATNLAMAFASVNRKVLLIDADLRRPRVHTLFGLSRKVGLSDLLNGAAMLDESGLIQASGINNLSIIACGSATIEETIILHAGRLEELIERLRGTFQTIVIDTPPILQIPDARVVARFADSVILVARCGTTTRDSIGAARDRLAEDGTKVLGIVLNAWKPQSSANGYYGYYGRTYKRSQQYYNKSAK